MFTNKKILTIYYEQLRIFRLLHPRSKLLKLYRLIEDRSQNTRLFSHDARRSSMLFEITLMVFLCPVEVFSREYLSHNLVFMMRRFFLERGKSGFFLLFTMIEDDRAVLLSYIGALSMIGSRVVNIPKKAKKFLIAHFRGIVFDLHDFSMSRISPADFLVARVGNMPSFIA